MNEDKMMLHVKINAFILVHLYYEHFALMADLIFNPSTSFKYLFYLLYKVGRLYSFYTK